jgi:hypothetical protein
MTDTSIALIAQARSAAAELVATMSGGEASSPLGIFVAGLAASFGEHLSHERDETASPETDAERRRGALQARRLKETCIFMLRMAPALVKPRLEPEAALYYRDVSKLLAEHIEAAPLPDVDDRTVDVNALLEALPLHLSFSELLIGNAEDRKVRGINLGNHRIAYDKVVSAAARLDNAAVDADSELLPDDVSPAPTF